LNLAGTPHHWAQPWAAGAAEAALALAAQWLQPRQRCSTHEYVGICSHQLAHAPSPAEPSPCSR